MPSRYLHNIANDCSSNESPIKYVKSKHEQHNSQQNSQPTSHHEVDSVNPEEEKNLKFDNSNKSPNKSINVKDDKPITFDPEEEKKHLKEKSKSEEENKKLKYFEKAERERLENKRLVEKYYKIIEEEDNVDDKSLVLIDEEIKDKDVVEFKDKILENIDEDDTIKLKTKSGNINNSNTNNNTYVNTNNNIYTNSNTILYPIKENINTEERNSNSLINSANDHFNTVVENEINNSIKHSQFKTKVKNYFLEKITVDEDELPAKLIIKANSTKNEKNKSFKISENTIPKPISNNLDFLFNSDIMDKINSEVNELLEYNKNHFKFEAKNKSNEVNIDKININLNNSDLRLSSVNLSNSNPNKNVIAAGNSNNDFNTSIPFSKAKAPTQGYNQGYSKQNSQTEQNEERISHAKESRMSVPLSINNMSKYPIEMESFYDKPVVINDNEEFIYGKQLQKNNSLSNSLNYGVKHSNNDINDINDPKNINKRTTYVRFDAARKDGIQCSNCNIF